MWITHEALHGLYSKTVDRFDEASVIDLYPQTSPYQLLAELDGLIAAAGHPSLEATYAQHRKNSNVPDIGTFFPNIIARVGR